MKNIQKPQSKEKAIALGFTLGIHVVAITGLLFLGLSQPPEPPKQIKTVLIKPEDLPPPEPKPLVETDATETADSKVAENTQQTAEPDQTAPEIPTEANNTPDTKAIDAQKAAEQAKAAALEQQLAMAAAKAAQEKALKLSQAKAYAA